MKKESFLKRNRFILLAFIIPFVLMTIAFALMKVSPFGDKQILVTDLWHQYYPFLVDFQDKLKNGESLFWSWTQGGGVNYFALMSYYLVSPLNFLTVFLPAEWLREYLMFSVALRVALAGMFMAIFLRSVYRKNDFSLVVFGCSFSFCAFFMGYYWNTIWLDAVCLTPLVVLGAVKLLEEKKFRLYVTALAASLLTNYYIGFFTCIFMLMVFAGYSILRWENKAVFVRKFLRMGIFSLIGIGMTAFLLLPAFLALQNTNAVGSSFPTGFAINIGKTNDFIGFLSAVKQVLSNFVTFSAPAVSAYGELPNVACGTISLVMGILFLTSKKIPKKEKLVNAGMLLFLILSFILRQLDYIWHGMHFPNMILYRFSYLASFVLIVMAFRAWMVVDFASKRELLITMLGTACIVAFALTGEQEKYAVAGTAVVAMVLLCVLLIYRERILSKKAVMLILGLIMLGECGVTAYIGVETTKVTSMEGYPRGNADAGKLIAEMKEMEKDTPELWRAETSKYQTLNDGALNGYNGLSEFSSATNVNMTKLFENLGLMGWKSGNRYTYGESTPVVNTFLNLKYLIDRDGAVRNFYDLTEASAEGSVRLYKNEHYLPMGFMTESALADWAVDENEDKFNPFDTQSEFFRQATGVEEPLYTPVDVATQGHTDFEQFPVEKTAYGNYKFSCNDKTITPSLKWNFQVEEAGLYFVYAKVTEGEDISVTKRADYGAEAVNCGNFYMKRGYIACVGEFEAGEILSVSTTLPQGQGGTAQVFVNKFNTEVFEKGFERISRDVMTTTKLSGNRMEGTIDVSEDGMFYTSIPYEKGWSAKVDGEKVEITPVGNALLAFPLMAGTHEITLNFCPSGFLPGLAVTLVSLAAFALLCLCERKHRGKSNAA